MNHKKIGNKIHIPYKEVKQAIETHHTLGLAAISLNVSYRTFRRIAVEYKLFDNTKSKRTKVSYDLIDILNGKHPQYPTSKITRRLIKEGYKKYECEICNISSWRDKPISLELDHIDGNNSNHTLNNLRILCPNCHSQTETYRSKNIKQSSNL